MLYDTFHANIEEKDPVGVIAPNIEQIIHVHTSENDRGTPGKGHVPWAATFKALKDGGYDGWYVIEAFGRALPGSRRRRRGCGATSSRTPTRSTSSATTSCVRVGKGLSITTEEQGRSIMKSIKGPAIFLAQFVGDEPPFNSFDAICGWAASLGYKGVQIAAWDGRLIDLEKAA